VPRVPQTKGDKGSQKWIQLLVNQKPDIFNAQIKEAIPALAKEKITWLSPKADDEYAEYRDQAFVDCLGVNLPNVPLSKFWPKQGPQWDALGKSDKGTLFLVEAKAHIPEIVSPATQAKGQSLRNIQARLDETKHYLNAKSNIDWSTSFYQYTNRLTHLYLFRVLNDLPTYLLFVNFVNDAKMDGPKSVGEWQGALKLLHTYLGIRRNKLSKYILELFIDVDFAK
jgi:hypothetical protein